MRKILLSILCFSSPALATVTTLIDNSVIPYTITNSGNYLVIENISYAAATTTTAITINASDVSLELFTYNFAQTGGNANVTAIAVGSGYSNVTINDGIIKDFSLTGISIGSGCSRIYINNVNLLDCGSRGIEFVGTVASPITESEITNCSILSSCSLTTADNVLTLSNVNNVQVSNCILNENGSTTVTGTLVMVKMTNAVHCEVKEIILNSNNGNFDLRGISLNNSTYCLFEDCRINCLTAGTSGSYCRGFMLEGSTTSTGNIFNQCIARSVSGALAVDGFLSSTNCDDNLFQNCISELHQASATNGAVHGYRVINNNRNSFKLCSAHRNTAPNSTVGSPLYGAYGFKIDSATGTFIHQCIANDQSASTRAVGFFHIASTLCSTTECTASHNTFGFDANALLFNNNAFSKNFASKNTGATQYNGFGINAANDTIAAASIAINTTLALGPVSWSNVGIT